MITRDFPDTTLTTVEKQELEANQRKIRARNKVLVMMQEPDNRERVFSMVAEGRTVSRIAKLLGVDYSVLHRLVTNKYSEDYESARRANADRLVEKNLKTADDVESGELEPAAAKVSSGIRQWYAERANNQSWGNKSSMDLNVKGTVGLHMEALRKVMAEPLEGEYEEIVDEPEEQAQDQQQDDNDPPRHPLL